MCPHRMIQIGRTSIAAAALAAVASITGCGPAPAPAPEATAVAAPSAPASSAALATTTVATAHEPVAVHAQSQPEDHPRPLPDGACRAQATSDAATPALAVHRWVDAYGIRHYSDHAPVDHVTAHRIIEVSGVPPIRVQATGYDVDLPEQFQQRAVADALGVQRVLHDALGVAAPRNLTLHVVFVSSAQAYAGMLDDPLLATSAGAYSPARRTIYVRRQVNDEASMTVVRHEITHALVHEAIGSLPTPLNEGLAEYFGRYRIEGLGGQIDIGAGRASIIAAAPSGDGTEALVDLIAREDSAFYAASANTAHASTREQRYVRAYALVALLMRDAQGRAALAAVLAAQRADPCTPVRVEEILERSFKGGLRALAGDWAGFMRDPPSDVRAY